jgi:hypothetical protein
MPWKPPRLTCTFTTMNPKSRSARVAAKIAIGAAAALLIVVCGRQVLGASQNASDFPHGFDAVTAAPDNHKVIFENALVRVGKTEPMHAIETVEYYYPPNDPPSVRVEIKVQP